jgi:hypothetical protein
MSSLPPTATAIGQTPRTTSLVQATVQASPAYAQLNAIQPLQDRVQFSANHNLPAAQPGLIRKYAWPATLVTMGSILGLTGALFAWTGIGVFGHLIGLGLLGLGLHKGWKAFRQTEEVLPHPHHHEPRQTHVDPEHDMESTPAYSLEPRPGERQLDAEAEPPSYPRH